MGKIQVVAVNVEGGDGAISEAIKMAAHLFHRNGDVGETSPAPAAIAVPEAKALPAARAKAKVKRQKAKVEEPEEGPPWICYECNPNREFPSKRSRGVHMGQAHKELFR